MKLVNAFTRSEARLVMGVGDGPRVGTESGTG